MMNGADELRFTLQRAEFFAVGRALQRGMGKALLGPVNLRVHDGKLRIDSQWGALRFRS